MEINDTRVVTTFSTTQNNFNHDCAVIRQGTESPRSHQYIDIICGCCGKYIAVPVYCGNRFCRICSVVRNSKARKRMDWLIAQVKPNGRYGFSHLTLTIPNETSLSEMVKSIRASFRKLRQTKFWKKRVIGGVFVIEITGEEGNWHAHIHAIIEARYMLYDKLVELWKRCSGGIGVWIARIKKKGITSYITKYLTKAGTPEAQLYHMSSALKGARLISPFGSWYAISALYVKPVGRCKDCKATDFSIASILLYGQFKGTYSRYD